ncbi:type III secretion system translocon subunit SctE [Pandoraea pnomenusa]|uniref:type III secretion system translocon subunit SctE n=1 Tax=Pandoraea pnomenusa TaxID=93220 RepID=UPI003CF9F8CF
MSSINESNNSRDAVSRYRRSADVKSAQKRDGESQPGNKAGLTVGKDAGSSVPGLGDPSVPEIPEAVFATTADGLALMLTSMLSKTSDVMVQSAATDMCLATKRRNSQNAEREQKVAEMRRKNAEAAEKNNNPILKIFNKIFSGIGYVIGMAALTFATVLTLGATAPLLAAAVYGSGKQMAEGTFDFSMTKAMQVGVTDALVGMGMSEKDAQDIAKIAVGVGMALTVMGLIVAPDAIGDMAGGAASLAGANDTTVMAIQAAVSVAVTIAVAIAMTVASGGTAAGAMAAQISQKISAAVLRSVDIAKAAYGIAQGGLSVANGSVGISVALNRRDASEFEAQIAELAVALKQLAQLDQNNKEIIETYMGLRPKMCEDMSNLIKTSGEMSSQLSANLA